MFGVDVGAIPYGFRASITVPWHHLCTDKWHSFNCLPKSGPTRLVVTVWWLLHTPIHSICRLSITLYIFGVDVGDISCGVRASTTAPWHHLWAQCQQHRSQLNFQIWANKFCGNSMMMDTPIDRVWKMSIMTFYMFKFDVRSIPCGFRASTTVPWHCLLPCSDHNFCWLAKSGPTSLLVIMMLRRAVLMVRNTI